MKPVVLFTLMAALSIPVGAQVPAQSKTRGKMASAQTNPLYEEASAAPDNLLAGLSEPVKKKVETGSRVFLKLKGIEGEAAGDRIRSNAETAAREAFGQSLGPDELEAASALVLAQAVKDQDAQIKAASGDKLAALKEQRAKTASTLSNILKTRHGTVKNSINNVR